MSLNHANQNSAAHAVPQQTVLTREQVGELYENWVCVFGANPGGAEICIREIEAAVLSALRAPVAAPSDETLRLAGVIADKIEDGTLFQAGIFSRRELADRVRAVVLSVRVASAPVAGEAQTYCPTEPAVRKVCDLLDKIKKSHEHWGGWSSIPSVCDEAISLLRYSGTEAAPQVRPFDDDMWDQALKERDHYHDMADRLASAIGTYFGADVGEHSSSHSPWHEALRIIDVAAPQASAEDVRNAALEEAYEAVMCVCAADYQQSELSNFYEPLRALKKAGDYIRALKPPQAGKREIVAWFDARAALVSVAQPEQGKRDANKA